MSDQQTLAHQALQIFSDLYPDSFGDKETYLRHEEEVLSILENADILETETQSIDCVYHELDTYFKNYVRYSVAA